MGNTRQGPCLCPSLTCPGSQAFTGSLLQAAYQVTVYSKAERSGQKMTWSTGQLGGRDRSASSDKCISRAVNLRPIQTAR